MEDKGIITANASIVANAFGENALDRKDVMDIFNNPNNYPLPLELYNRNKGLLDEAKKQAQVSNEQMLARQSATLSSQDFAKISIALDDEEKRKTIEQEKILTNQYRNDKANLLDRFWSSTKRNYYGMDLGEKYWEIAERQHNGENVDFGNIEVQELENKINELSAIKAGEFTEALGAFAGSSGQFIVPAVAGGGIAAKIPQLRLANAVYQSYNVFNKSKKAESGHLYKEMLDEGYDKETAYAFADMYGDFSGAVEAAGFGLGSNVLVNKAIKSIAKRMVAKDGVKEAVKSLDKKTLSKIFRETLKDSALSALPETGEELLQNEAAKQTKEMLSKGEKPNLAKLAYGSYEKSLKDGKNVILKSFKGEDLSDDEQDFLDTAIYTSLASFTLGSPVAGIGALAKYKGQDAEIRKKTNKIISDGANNEAKTQKTKELMKENKLRKESPELDNKLTDLIVKSNNADGNIYLSQEGIDNLLEKSKTDKELADFIAPYNLEERAKNSVDGMVAIPLNEAKDLIFSEEADKVFSYVSSDISWSKDAMTPNQASETISKAVGDNLFGAKQETFDELTKKLYDRNIEQKFDSKKAEEYAKAEASVALNIANSLSANDKEHDTQYYLNQILESTSVDAPAVNNGVVNGVFNQAGFAGSPVDYKKPSLEAIGSGEHNQAHGWGLYYALNRFIAESYRRTFVVDKLIEKITSEMEKISQQSADKWNRSKIYEELDLLISSPSEEHLKEYISRIQNKYDFLSTNSKLTGRTDQEIEAKEYRKILDILKSMKPKDYTGQVVEVDLPENVFLLDEQKTLDEQPENVINLLSRVGLISKTNTSFDEFLDYIKKTYSNTKYGEDVSELIDSYAFRDLLSLSKEKNILSKKDEQRLKFYTQTGRDFYKELSIELGSDEAASRKLSKIGIKGITYNGREDGRCFVIFDDKDVEVLDKFYERIGGKANLTPAMEASREEAKKMAKENVAPLEILKKTGWEFDDGHWKYEIDDSKSKVKDFKVGAKGLELPDVLDHPELYELYPFLKEMPITWGRSERTRGAYHYAIKYLTGEIADQHISLSKALTKTKKAKEELRKTLIHEIQHAIQHHEGWKGGSSGGRLTANQNRQFFSLLMFADAISEAFSKYDIETPSYVLTHAIYSMEKLEEPFKELIKADPEYAKTVELFKKEADKHREDFKKTSIAKYWRDLGEKEARNSTIRRNMTPEQRRNIPYSATTDIEPIEITYGGETIQVIDPTENENTSTVAGYFSPSKVEIRLTEARNPTTFSHELFHYFMFNMVEMYNNGTMKDEWKKPFVKTMKWAGAEEVDGKYTFDPTTDREAQEKLAEAFTSYLLEGKSPVKEVKGLFDILKDMFKLIYQSLRMKKVRLNKDVTMFFDKIFAAEGQIELQMRAEKVGVLERPEGVSDSDWNRYIELKEKSRGEAVNKTIDAMAKREEAMTTQAYKEQYDNAFNEKMNELNESPEYAALEIAGVQKFSKESVDAYVKEGALDNKFIATDKELKSTDNNVIANDISSFATKFGFSSVTELVDFLNNTESKKEVATNYAQEKADEWLKENYPELDEIEAKNAIRTTALIKTLVMEYMMLNKIPLERFNLYFNEMRKTANAIIGSSKLNEIANVESWYKRLANLINRISALQTGKNDKRIAGLKMKCAMMNYTILVAKEVRKEAKSFDRHFVKKYRSKPTSASLKKIEGRVWDIIADVLRSNKLIGGKLTDNNLSGRIENYVDETLRNKYSGIEEVIENIPYLVNSTNEERKNLSVEKFITLDGTLRLLEGVSRQERSIQVDGKIKEINEGVDNIIADASEKGTKAWTRKNRSFIKEVFVNFLGIPETMLSKIFPKKEFVKYVLGFQEGCAQAERWRTDISQQLADIIKPVMKYARKEIKIGETVWTMEELLVIMLNAGNAHNRNCMVRTIQKQKKMESFSLEDLMDLVYQIQPAIEESGYTGFDIREIAQNVWKLFEKYALAMQKEQEKLDGRQIHLIDKSEIIFPDGEKFDGGYYPARKADYSPTTESVHNTNGFVQSTFSMTLDRTGNGHEVPMDLSMLTSWVSQMGKLLFVANKANDLEKIARHEKFREVLGDRMADYIIDWLGTSLAPEKMSPTLASLGSMSSSYLLGSKLASFGVQLAGFVNALPIVGALPLLKSLAKMTTIVEIRSMYKQAFENSVYMRDRYSSPQNHLLGIEDLDKFLTSSLSKAQKTTTAVMMSAVTYGDMFASLIVWDAAYNRALKEGHTQKEAQLIADSAVRTTQSDTSASSKPKALRGLMRLLSPFASYFIAAHNLVTSRAIFGGGVGKVQAIAVLMVLCTLSPFVESMLRAPFDWYGSDDEDKRKLRRKKILNLEDFAIDRAKKNIPDTALNVIIPVYGMSGNVVHYFRTGRMNDLTVMPINTLTKIVSSPFAAIRSQIAPTEKQRENAKMDLAEVAGILSGINIKNAEKSLRFLTTIFGGK